MESFLFEKQVLLTVDFLSVSSCPRVWLDGCLFLNTSSSLLTIPVRGYQNMHCFLSYFIVICILKFHIYKFIKVAH